MQPTLEFLSSFEIEDDCMWVGSKKKVTFQLFGNEFQFTITEFSILMGYIKRNSLTLKNITRLLCFCHIKLLLKIFGGLLVKRYLLLCINHSLHCLKNTCDYS